LVRLGDEVRAIWASAEVPPSDAVRSALERSAFEPQYAEPDKRAASPWLRDVSDGALALARVAARRWRLAGVTDQVRPPRAASRRSRRLAEHRSRFAAALGRGGPLLDFCDPCDLARLEATCRAAWLPARSLGWLGAVDAVAKARLLEQKPEQIARKSARSTATYAHLLFLRTCCARVDLLIPPRTPASLRSVTTTAADLGGCAFRFARGKMVLKKGPRAMLRQGAMSTKSAWWALRKLDGAFLGRVDDGERLARLVADGDRHRMVSAEFELIYETYKFDVPIARRSLAAVFAKARAVVPAWRDPEVRIRLTRLERRNAIYRENEVPSFDKFLHLPLPFKTRLVASLDFLESESDSEEPSDGIDDMDDDDDGDY